MSKELADRLEAFKQDLWFTGNGYALINEAIAALRSEPVAWMWPARGGHRASYYDIDSPDAKSIQEQGITLTKLYAAPSRETAKEIPVNSKSQYRRVAAQGGNPVMKDQRESNSNPAPMHGQSKTGLAGSHPGAPTFHCPTCERNVTEPCSSADSASLIGEALSALRSEPVGFTSERELEQAKDGFGMFSFVATDEYQISLYAAQSRETDQRCPICKDTGKTCCDSQRSEDERVGSSQPDSNTQSSDHPIADHDWLDKSVDEQPTAEPALSAEQIELWRQRMNDLQAIGVAMPPGSNVLADMALSSLTARDEIRNRDIDRFDLQVQINKRDETIAELKDDVRIARDEGIEAAAKVCEDLICSPATYEEVRMENKAFRIAAEEIRALKGARHD